MPLSHDMDRGLIISSELNTPIETTETLYRQTYAVVDGPIKSSFLVKTPSPTNGLSHQQEPHMATSKSKVETSEPRKKKKTPTFHYTGWFVGILILAYYNWVVLSPIKTKRPGFFNCSSRRTPLHAGYTPVLKAQTCWNTSPIIVLHYSLFQAAFSDTVTSASAPPNSLQGYFTDFTVNLGRIASLVITQSFHFNVKWMHCGQETKQLCQRLA